MGSPCAPQQAVIPSSEAATDMDPQTKNAKSGSMELFRAAPTKQRRERSRRRPSGATAAPEQRPPEWLTSSTESDRQCERTDYVSTRIA